jgi:DNA end-binding protein Ku
MKAVWQGSLAFGLVNVPVKLYSAINPKEFSFRILCKDCNTPLKYKRWCPSCKKEVLWENVVKGIEVSKNVIVPLPKEKLQKLKPEKSDVIEILEFVDQHAVDPIYFNKHYYISPAKAKEKAYFLLKEVLQSTAKGAVGKFIMREKEHVCYIESYKSGLILTTLNYAYEIRNISQIPELKQAPKLKKEEEELAKELINKYYKSKFDITQFKDTFSEKIIDLVKGKKPKIIAKKPKSKSLMQALKSSVKK